MTSGHLEDEAVAFMAEIWDEVSEQLLGLRQWPKIFTAQAEGFLVVAVKPCRLFYLQAPLSEVSFLGSGTDYLSLQQMPPLLQGSKLQSASSWSAISKTYDFA